MMEYEQRLEAAARRLCEIRGVNPNDAVSFRTPGDLTLAIRYRARWKNVADELRVAIERARIAQLLTEYDLI